MKKNIYRATNVNKINFEKIAEAVLGQSIVVGIDVAKKDNFACLMDENRRAIVIVKWAHPTQTRQFVDFLTSLPTERLVAAMESSGVYGDCLRHLLQQSGIDVYRVGAKRTHDAAEVYDGVPSSHDAKSATIICRLHLDGGSRLWDAAGDYRLDLKAAADIMDLHDEQYHCNLNRLEAMLSRHWPEATEILGLDSRTLWKVILRHGGPMQVRQNRKAVFNLMRKTGGHFLSPEKINRLIESVDDSLGVPMTSIELRKLKLLAGEISKSHKLLNGAKNDVEKLSMDDMSVQAIGEVVGRATAAIIVVEVGDPDQFESASSYEKAAGMNIKERSSGRHCGQKKITKRGSGKARRWLYMAALRMIRDNEIVKAWHASKVARDGGKKMKSIIAIMRKLIKALWHVGQGEQFDASKLFDVKRLGFKVI